MLNCARGSAVRIWLVRNCLFAFAAALSFMTAPMASAAVFTQPSNSSPIALSANQKLVWVVNPRNNTVSVIRTDLNTVIANITTGQEPRSVALDPNDTYAYVANAAGSSVSIIKILNANPNTFSATVVNTLKTGAEPWDIVASPDGKRIFVANSGQDTITVINALNRTVVGSINLRNSICNNPDRTRHFQPRGMAVILANTQLYVTRFLSFVKKDARQGTDNGKLAAVCRIAINTASTNIADYNPAQVIGFKPRISGFKVDSTGDGVPDDTSAFPNQLQSLVIRGNKGFMPNIAASPTSPLVFNTDTHAFVTVMNNIGTGVPGDGGSLNLHLGARNPEPGKKKLFFANTWAMAFTNQSGPGFAYVVSAGSDLLVKLRVTAADNLRFTVDDDTTRYIDLNDPGNPGTSGGNAGKNPVGIVIRPANNRAYVANFVSGNVSIVNLNTDQIVKVVRTAPLPPPGSQAERVLVGAEMFFSSRGHFIHPSGATASTDERLSSEGWQNCASCHFNGWTDGVVWQFGAGPRKSVNLAGSFNPNNPNQQKILNYSAIFDEIEDFELNIRNVSGPGALPAAVACETGTGTSTFNRNQGLLIGDNGDINKPPCVVNQFAKANANREQVGVNPVGPTTRVDAMTALREWVRRAIRPANGPLNSNELPGGVPVSTINAGRTLVVQQCATCHNGGLFSSSLKNFVSPPAGNQIACEVDLAAAAPPGSFCTKAPVTGDPINNQYLNAFLEDVGSFNLGVPGQGNGIDNNIGADEKAAKALVAGVSQVPKDALGIDYNNDGRGEGFNVQSLLGVFSSQPYMHNGACESIACVVGDVEHRTGNGRFTDFLNTDDKRRKVVRFVESIDADTNPVPAP